MMVMSFSTSAPSHLSRLSFASFSSRSLIFHLDTSLAIFLSGLHDSPTHISGGGKAQDLLAAPLVCEEI